MYPPCGNFIPLVGTPDLKKRTAVIAHSSPYADSLRLAHLNWEMRVGAEGLECIPPAGILSPLWGPPTLKNELP